MIALGLPRYRSIVAIDIEASTTRTNTGRAMLRHDMYRIFESALRLAGIAPHNRDPFLDRGDGILAMIHPVDDAPKTLLLRGLMPTLSRAVAEHNQRRPDRSLRLRTALHAGEVHYDDHGCYGEDIDLTVRLLDAPEVRSHLSRSADPLVLVVSDTIHQSVIRHGYQGINDLDYAATVTIRLAGRQHLGWVHFADQPSDLAFRAG